MVNQAFSVFLRLLKYNISVICTNNKERASQVAVGRPPGRLNFCAKTGSRFQLYLFSITLLAKQRKLVNLPVTEGSEAAPG